MTKEQTATLLEFISQQVAEENGWPYWIKIPPSKLKDELWEIVCERYATDKATNSVKASLKKAAENARLETNFERREHGKVVEKWEPIISETARLQSNAQVRPNKESITSKDNHCIL